MTALAYAAVILVLAGCAAYAASVLPGHRRAWACLYRTILVHGLIAATLASIAAVCAWRTGRHPLRYARYLAWWARYARARRHPAPGPGRDDGEKLTSEEAQALSNLDAGRDVRSRT